MCVSLSLSLSVCVCGCVSLSLSQVVEALLSRGAVTCAGDLLRGMSCLHWAVMAERESEKVCVCEREREREVSKSVSLSFSSFVHLLDFAKCRFKFIHSHLFHFSIEGGGDPPQVTTRRSKSA